MARRQHRRIKVKPDKDPTPLRYGLDTAEEPSKNYLLTRLPLELRIKIYRFVLPSTPILQPKVDQLFQNAEQQERVGYFHKLEKVLALARCNKQLHDEVLSTFYGDHTFSFWNTYELYRYLYMLGPERRGWLQNIEVYLLTGLRYSPKVMTAKSVFKLAFDLLADCVELKKLYIGVCEESTEGLSMKHYRNLLKVREWGCFEAVRGLGKGVGGLDLKVREVLGDHRPFNRRCFEVDVMDVSIWQTREMFFQLKDVLEFERVLTEDFKRPREVDDDEVEKEKSNAKSKVSAKRTRTAIASKSAAAGKKRQRTSGGPVEMPTRRNK